jgi:hypothetical protein
MKYIRNYGEHCCMCHPNRVVYPVDGTVGPLLMNWVDLGDLLNRLDGTDDLALLVL